MVVYSEARETILGNATIYDISVASQSRCKRPVPLLVKLRLSSLLQAMTAEVFDDIFDKGISHDKFKQKTT